MRARLRAEATLRRAEKARDNGNRLCLRSLGQADAVLTRHIRTGNEVIEWARRTRVVNVGLLAESADHAAEACRRMANAHVRLARAGYGDAADHQRQAAQYHAVAQLLHETATWYQEAAVLARGQAGHGVDRADATEAYCRTVEDPEELRRVYQVIKRHWEITGTGITATGLAAGTSLPLDRVTLRLEQLRSLAIVDTQDAADPPVTTWRPYPPR